MASNLGNYLSSMGHFRVEFWLPVAVVVIPSTAVFVRVLMIYSRRKSLFARQFMIQSIIDLLLLYLYLAGQLVVKDQPQGGEFLLWLNGTFFPKFYYYGTIYYFFHVQVWGVIVQSCIRFLAVCLPSSKAHQNLYKIHIVVWFFVYTLLPMAMVFRQFYQDETSFIIDESGNVVVDSPPHVIQSNAMQSMIVTSIATAFGTVCLVLILIQLSRERKHSTPSDNRSNRRFALICLSVFVALSFLTVYSLVVLLAAFKDANLVVIMHTLYIVPVMLMTFNIPYMLIFTDRRLRMKLLRRAKPIKTVSRVTTLG